MVAASMLLLLTSQERVNLIYLTPTSILFIIFFTSGFASFLRHISMQGWSRNRDYKYPEDFGDILNKVTIYTCSENNKRIILSNGIPDHNVRQANPNFPCETNWAISVNSLYFFSR